MSDDGGKRTEDPGAIMESDEEDEDYVPGVDPDERVDDDDDDENDAAVGVGADADDAATRPALSITKRRAADDAFLELFGYPYAPTPPARDGPSTDGKSRDKLPAKGRKRRVADKRRSILSTIFGRNAARKLVSRAKFAAAFGRPKAGGGGMLRLERRVVVEVKRFAGQEIRVEKVVMVPVMAGEGKTVASEGAAGKASGESTVAAAAGGGGARGVDDLLDEMSRPEKLSTVAKTSADWDLFKSKNADAALKEQLESKARGNEAYLVKKDFLGRVDERRFELERRERDRERAKRGK